MKKIKIPILMSAMMLAFAIAGAIPFGAASAIDSTYSGASTVTVTKGVGNTNNRVFNTFTYNITLINDASDYYGLAPGEINTPSGWNTFKIKFDEETGDPVSDVFYESATIDFSNVTFSTTGVYVFRVTEVDSENPDIYPVDERETQIIKAKVTYPMDENRVPDNTQHEVQLLVMESVYDDDEDDVVETKQAALQFYSDATFTDIKVQQFVHGDLARKDQCFPYYIMIITTGPVHSGNTFSVQTPASACSGNPSEITAGEKTAIYLKHGETIQITVPAGAEYKIARAFYEEPSWPSSSSYNTIYFGDGYSGSISDAGAGAITVPNVVSRLNEGPHASDYDTIYSSKTANADADANINTTIIVRELSSEVLAGIFTNIWIWIILIALAMASIFFIIKRTSNKQQHLKAE